MKNKWMKAIVAVGALLVVTGGTLLATTVLGNRMKIVLDGEFAPDSTIEYTNESIQFPMAHIENRNHFFLNPEKSAPDTTKHWRRPAKTAPIPV